MRHSCLICCKPHQITSRSPWRQMPSCWEQLWVHATKLKSGRRHCCCYTRWLRKNLPLTALQLLLPLAHVLVLVNGSLPFTFSITSICGNLPSMKSCTAAVSKPAPKVRRCKNRFNYLPPCNYRKSCPMRFALLQLGFYLKGFGSCLGNTFGLFDAYYDIIACVLCVFDSIGDSMLLL